VVRDLDLAKIAVRDVGVRRSTLDDVFFSLTGHAAEEDGEDGDGQTATSADTTRAKEEASLR
jgi:ABC-2 type transport system ATP-binding protein